ncbi:MAG: protein-methionine-sulfoxide reductase catalytic subunit MsrP [Chloroflexi bacterium]|nr:protein-methionine-sulfoxide reductase catalytic subunit MsrP [Chloroflexota bacterium]
MVKPNPRQELPMYITLNRRHFLVKVVPMAAGALLLAACSPGAKTTNTLPQATTMPPASGATAMPASGALNLPAALAHNEPFSTVTTDELGDALNTFDQITHYNNYYEFSTDKEAPAELAKNFTPTPWSVEVKGMVNKPRTLSLDELYTLFTQEEHVYRLRCVEAWSMAIPWVGFHLGDLLKMVEPQPTAKYVKFVSVFRKEQMPNQNFPILSWPYVEGLRVDEAMNNLTILATGMYGKLLTNQQGAPVRLVVPWKYGFKSIKAITTIELTDQTPTSAWMDAASHEYGFYANVNPQVDHPRWSQASERRIGQLGRRKTLMFNGCENQVASLYDGLDLRANY